MIIEREIKYFKKETKYQFCYYSISEQIDNDITVYCLEYIEANIGNTKEFEVFVCDSFNKMEEYKQRVLKPYTLDSIPLKKINIKIYLYEKFESKIDIEFKTNQLSNSINYVSKTYGNGINHFIDPIINNKNGKFIYEVNIEIHDEFLFQENLYSSLEYVVAKKEDIVIYCLNE
jgi:hypothetical protein